MIIIFWDFFGVLTNSPSPQAKWSAIISDSFILLALFNVDYKTLAAVH